MARYLYHKTIYHEYLNKQKTIAANSIFELKQKEKIQLNLWEEQWTKKQQEEINRINKEQAKRNNENGIRYAEKLTSRANEIHNKLEKVLADSILIPEFSFLSLKDHSEYFVPCPNRTSLGEPVKEPIRSDELFNPKPSFFIKISKKKKTAFNIKNDRLFQETHDRWNELNCRHNENVKRWEFDKLLFEQERDKHNAEVDEFEKNVSKGDSSAVCSLISILIDKINIPLNYSPEFDVEYYPENKTANLKVVFPTIGLIPKLKSVSFIKSRQEYKETYYTDNQIQKKYDELKYKLILVYINKVFSVNRLYDLIDTVLFKGIVNMVDKSTGNVVEAYISVNVEKRLFSNLNLTSLDPKEWFRSVNGFDGTNLSQVTAAQKKEALKQKQLEYYDKVNNIIDYSNDNRELLVMKDSQKKLDDLIAQLFDRTINSIKKIKSFDSEEWGVIGEFISRIESDVKIIVADNRKILDYYESEDFTKIKETCEALMSSQREFNAYINEKVQLISELFGTRTIRNETVSEDEYNYIRPYKKSITPFNAEVSSTVFASAENNPMEYIVKTFYPDKSAYPKQIQKLQLLVEELETLKDAKQIIENYKKEYHKYIINVPDYIMKNDESGFYSRLGFANIDESVLVVEYKFSYTSGGGFAQRSFTIPMTEENIVELIKILDSKLTASAFAKEQRTLMTKKLRDYIKERDNYTCCGCGNSTNVEPNLLLEIDHIIPISKGGLTEEDNLQTLCWKCNRAKSDKIIL